MFLNTCGLILAGIIDKLEARTLGLEKSTSKMVSSFISDTRLGSLKERVNQSTYVLDFLLGGSSLQKQAFPMNKAEVWPFRAQPWKLHGATLVTLSLGVVTIPYSYQDTDSPLIGRSTNVFAVMFSNTYSESSVSHCLVHQQFELELLLISMYVDRVSTING